MILAIVLTFGGILGVGIGVTLSMISKAKRKEKEKREKFLRWLDYQDECAKNFEQEMERQSSLPPAEDDIDFFCRGLALSLYMPAPYAKKVK